MEEKEVIAKMRELGIDHAKFVFYCGGDSMGDTHMEYCDKDGNTIDNSELDSYFDDEVYNKITFYEASDGHYCGEDGHVLIEIDMYEGEETLSYVKLAQAEWSECVSEEIPVELTKEEVAFIKAYIENINGGEGEWTNVNYSTDFIMTNEQQALLESIKAKVDKAVEDCEPNYIGDNPQDWYNFSTEDMKIENDTLIVYGTFYEYIYTDSDL